MALTAANAPKPEEYPAMLDVNASQLPQIKNWKLGGVYKLVLEAEMVNHGKGYGPSDGPSDGPVRASFKIRSIKSAGQLSENNDKEVAPDKETKMSVLSSKAKTA